MTSFTRLGRIAEWHRRQALNAVANAREFVKARQHVLWLLALLVGVGVGLVAVGFREAIGLVQWLWTEERGERVIEAIRAQPWWVILLAPTLGGVVVGLINQYILIGRRPEAVADVIQARLEGGTTLTARNGFASALATVISLGAGASAGREGPVVHLGATVSAIVNKIFGLNERERRVLLGCGVAAAISASFNAPIAGVLFAHEVILAHYAMSFFVPITIASVAGTLVGRTFIGDVAAFSIPPYEIASYTEMPAFALLGVAAAAVAIAFQFALVAADTVARSVVLPTWLRPVIGGVVVGTIGIFVPEVLGVGYEATDIALHGDFVLATLLTLLVVKMLATAFTLASRFGGGIFSPSLYLGAMTGGAFGIIASSVFPEYASDIGLYAILGMGAVASAMLGAPISTTMIVFELTGGYTLSIALLLTVSIASALQLAVHGRSFFEWQLATRGVNLHHHYHLKTIKVASFMTPLDKTSLAEEALATEARLSPNDSLETCLRRFNELGVDVLAVADPRKDGEAVGVVTHVQALTTFNRCLVAASVEEHR